MPQIVVIDDRVTNRQILQKLAESLGDDIRVHSFGDPLRALEWTAQHVPDLAITDYKMPGLTGAQFVRRFREQPEAGQVPVIVVTAYEDREYRYEALAAGATDFLLSPLDAVEFRARARNLLTIRRQHHIISRRAHILEQRLEEHGKQHELELQLSEQRFQLVVNTVPVMINTVDPDGRCLITNNEQCRFFGIDPQDALHRPIEESFGRSYGERHRTLNKMALSNKGETITSFEEILVDQFGETRVFLTTKAPLKDGNGSPTSVVTISVDITPRKRFEQELAAAKLDAEHSNHAKTEFLANMSHELRTPLNAIIGFAEMMRDQRLGPVGTPKYLEYSRDIWQSARHLLGIINDLLDLSQIEGGALPLEQSELSVESIVGEIGRLLQPQSAASGVALNVIVDGPLPPINADPLRLKQALLNLVGNALKFTSAGGCVEVHASASGQRIQIEVVDTGIGMSDAEIRVALTRFGRVESALSRRHPGTGLGLPLAVDLIRLQGGDLDIASTPGKGTRITVSFPLVPAAGNQWPKSLAL
jgi:two-component system cell cycle sensor histidine kinase PleC